MHDDVSKPFFAVPVEVFAREVGAGVDRIIVLVLDNAGWHGEAGLNVLIPIDDAPLKRDEGAPEKGMMAPPGSQIIPRSCNEMIPPGGFCAVAVAVVGLVRSLLWQYKGAINASGADYDAPGARDYSAEGHIDFDARDIPAPLHGARSTVRGAL